MSRTPQCGDVVTLTVNIRQGLLGLIGSEQVVYRVPELERGTWLFGEEFRARWLGQRHGRKARRNQEQGQGDGRQAVGLPGRSIASESMYSVCMHE